LVSASQASGILVFGVMQNPVTGSYPIIGYNLYRSVTGTGGWVEVRALQPISSVLLTTNCFDIDPVYGQQQYYAATAVDSQGAESSRSNLIAFSASAESLQIGGPSNLSPGAFGPYPLLGSDVFLDPITGEGVVGPNGDLLTVNGLELLAQDLRIRIYTDKGGLLLHPNYGFDKGRILGSGQAAPKVQAQILRADIMDVLQAEPRIQTVLDVEVQQSNQDSWVIGYDVMAIGVEGPQRLNLVFPFYKQ